MLWTAIYFFDRDGMMVSLAAAAAVHELSHIGAILCAGGRAEGLNFSFTGLEILCRTELLSYGREFLCAGAGPLGSIALAVIASKTGLYTLAGVSLVLGLYNLLPISFLDGGKMLYCAAARFAGCDAGEKTVFMSGIVTVAALGIAGVWLRRRRLLYFALILGICCCKNGPKGVKSKHKARV